VTYNNITTGPAARANEKLNAISIADLDLTPQGLDDAPAHQEDAESIVYTGNS
jgi:hypothetical protein